MVNFLFLLLQPILFLMLKQFFKKQILIKNLVAEKKSLESQLYLIEKKNNLLTAPVDIDYLETLYREKFMVGKKGEKIFIKQ